MNGRNKGTAAEREVAGLIQKWWRQYNIKANFVRVPLSGGWGNPTTRANFRASGDIMTDDYTFPFSVEVKRREGWAWKNLLEGKKSPVWKWWFQAQDQAKEMRLEPMLWLRHSREPWMIMVPESGIVGRMAGIDHFWSRHFWKENNFGTNAALVQAERFFIHDPLKFL
jgi:hypothetical protein